MGHKVKVACVDLGGSTIPIDEMYVWVREIPKREEEKFHVWAYEHSCLMGEGRTLKNGPRWKRQQPLA